MANNFIKRFIPVIAVICCLVLILTSCKEEKANTEVKDTETVTETQTETQAQTETDIETEESQTTPVDVTESESTVEDEKSELIARVQGASDETGIYSFIITLSDKAADKGQLEYIYYGPKGSAQENVIVNTFIANYFKEESGTFDITTYYDGEILYHKTKMKEIKVDNTFGALVRAGKVVVSYTPDGGEKVEIYQASYEEFQPKSNKAIWS